MLSETTQKYVAKYTPKLGEPRNTKLGALIHTWSITAGVSCPGKTKACASVCYAKSGFFRMHNVANGHERNLKFSKTAAFVPWMQEQLDKNKVAVLRVHVAGDFYSAAYALKWLEIMKIRPNIVFYLYTRSWRKSAILPVLRSIARLENVHFWLSADTDTVKPPRIAQARVAWMARNDDEALSTPAWADLVFRDAPKTTMKKAGNGVQVCPFEIAVPKAAKIGCSQCKICFKPQRG
jgi:hypothetical protein